MAPAKGRGRPKKAATADAKTETTVASPKTAQNGAKKAGRGRPAGKVAKTPKPAPAPTKAKKEAVVEAAKAVTPAKSPKTDSSPAAAAGKGRGRPKKGGAAAAKQPAKSPAAKKGGRGRKPAADVDDKDPEEMEEQSPEKVSKRETNEPSRKRAKKVLYKEDSDEEAEFVVKKKVPKEKAPKEKKAKAEPKPKLNKAHTNFENIDFSTSKDFNYKISSINVAGFRAFIEKGGLDFVEFEKPDVLCLQETKCEEDKLPEAAKNLKGYHPYWLCKPGGHAGVALYSKVMPINVEYGIGDAEQDSDGRILTAEYEKFFLVCTYVPNAGRKLVTLDKRLRWNLLFEAHLKKLDGKKPVIIAGDMNVAHEEIDLANPKTNKRNAGFTQEERDGMSDMLKMGFVDTFRHFYPEKEKAYTFWTYMGNARAKNVGWRLDYFLASERLVGKVVDNVMRGEVMGSDHCPITLFLKL